MLDFDFNYNTGMYHHHHDESGETIRADHIINGDFEESPSEIIGFASKTFRHGRYWASKKAEFSKENPVAIILDHVTAEFLRDNYRVIADAIKPRSLPKEFTDVDIIKYFMSYIYQDLSQVSDKVVKEKWDQLFSPDLTDHHSLLEDLLTNLEEDYEALVVISKAIPFVYAETTELQLNNSEWIKALVAIDQKDIETAARKHGVSYGLSISDEDLEDGYGCIEYKISDNATKETIQAKQQGMTKELSLIALEFANWMLGEVYTVSIDGYEKNYSRTVYGLDFDKFSSEGIDLATSRRKNKFKKEIKWKK